MSSGTTTDAVVFEKPGKAVLRSVDLIAPKDKDLLVDIEATGVSTGTEKMLWDGTMPNFPGLGYPLVPGYEAVGTVRQAGSECNLKPGQRVFVPGASCYKGDVRGLFGGSASVLVAPEARVMPIASLPAEQATLLALAATAMHILTYSVRQSRPGKDLAITDILPHVPNLIVGHGVLGRLLARICLAVGAEAPQVWELDPQRQQGAVGYEVAAPETDISPCTHIVDVSGAGGQNFNRLIKRLAKGGRLTLGGFYKEPVQFDFAPAFMRETTLGIAAEWVRDDLAMTLALVQAGALNLDGLVTHQYTCDRAADAYSTAFNDASCLKMILNWSV